MPDTVFYDGHCGLCHHFVRFLIARDKAGVLFQFSPLGSEAFHRQISEEIRAKLPDSIVIVADGDILVRSRAAIRALGRLGGLWRCFAIACRVVPRPLADVVYDFIASIRRRIFGMPEDVCPVIPPELRKRFLQ
jgi:predicted DCC family thiol-disulfide oxidoreductase YuxK